MPNEPKVLAIPRLGEPETQRYIDGFGLLVEAFGYPPTGGRLLAYLLLMPAPVSLDQAAEDLQASKSSISVAARQMEHAGIIRRIHQRGSRRVLYEAMESFETMIEAELQLRAVMVEKVRQGMQIAPAGLARERLRSFAELYELSIDAGRRVLEDWRRDAARSRRSG